MEPTVLKFGGRPREKKASDYQLLTLAQAVSPLPKIDISSIPVEMQGSTLGICGAELENFMKEAMELQMGVSVHLSPSYGWKRLKQRDDIGINDGTDFPAIFSSMKNDGICQFGMVDEDITQTIEKYSDASLIPMSADEDAKTRVIEAYAYADRPTESDIQKLIDTYQFVGAVVEVGDEWYTSKYGVTSWAEADILPIGIPKTIISGHFICYYDYKPFPLPGYPDNVRYFFRNWWSDKWGAQGNGYHDSNYLPYILELGTAVSLPDRYPFLINLSLGSVSPDVRELQKLLNRNPATQIAASGAGSPGHETFTFGSLTKQAVIKYQTLNDLPATGYVGPQTRSIING